MRMEDLVPSTTVIEFDYINMPQKKDIECVFTCNLCCQPTTSSTLT